MQCKHTLQHAAGHEADEGAAGHAAIVPQDALHICPHTPVSGK